jgi:hypothetical protein
MVVRVGHTGVAGIVRDADVIDPAARCREICKALLGVEILQRDHVYCADELARVVIGEKRSLRQCARVDIESPEARQKIRQFHQLTDLLVSAARWRSFNILRDRGDGH